MSGRIALMVRGLPSISVEEALERFRKYYPKPVTGEFHRSPSFIGNSNNNVITFVNATTGSYGSGSGINLQKRTDLKKLGKDFKEYSLANPSVYINSPTTESRAKLYRRVGFTDSPDGSQFLDTRRIANEDLPYVRAIDKTSPLTKNIPNKSLEPFFKYGDNVIASSRLSKDVVAKVFQSNSPSDFLSQEIDKELSMRKQVRGMPNPFASPEDRRYWQEWNNALPSRIERASEFGNQQMYEFLAEDPDGRREIEDWMRRFNFNTFGSRLGLDNAEDITNAFSLARRDGFI